MEANVPRDRLWLGRSVKVVDGTGLSMADTAENQAAYPQSCSQKPGCGFPLLKLVGLFSLASGALLHVARSTQYVHESQLFVQLWPSLLEGDVVLGDRGFCSFLAIGSLLLEGTPVRLPPSQSAWGENLPRQRQPPSRLAIRAQRPISHRPCSSCTIEAAELRTRLWKPNTMASIKSRAPPPIPEVPLGCADPATELSAAC